MKTFLYLKTGKSSEFDQLSKLDKYNYDSYL